MKIVEFEGKHLRVWTTDELARVENVTSGRGAADMVVATDGSAIVGPFTSPCHPNKRFPSELHAVYVKAQRLLVLQCPICGGVVLAVEVQ